MASYGTRELKDGTIRHLARYREGGRRASPEKAIPFTDKKDADRFILILNAHRNTMPDDETLRKLGFGYLATRPDADIDRSYVGMVDYADQYIDTLETHRETKNKYGTYVRDYLRPYFGDIDLRAVVPDDIRAWQRWMTSTKGLSPKTVRNVRGTVLIPMFSNACKRQGDGGPALRDYSPVEGVDPPRSDPYNREFLRSTADARLLFSVAYEMYPDAADLLFVLASFANRWGEASVIMEDACFLGAALPYVEIRRKAVQVRGEGVVIEPGAKTKAGEFRRVPVGPAVGAVLARRCATRRGLLFVDGTNDVWWHGHFHRDRWKPIVKEARRRGLRYDLTMHGLRKSTLTLAAEMGVDPVTLQEFAGHKHASTTLQIYTSVSGRGRGLLESSVGDFYPLPGNAPGQANHGEVRVNGVVVA